MPVRRQHRVPIPAPAKKRYSGWHVKCSYCELEWGDRDTINLDAIGLHFDTAENHPGDKISFDLVWRGEGPEPPKPVENRAMRRAKERKKKH